MSSAGDVEEKLWPVTKNTKVLPPGRPYGIGVAVPAVVRVPNLERYKRLAQIAELVTLVALTTAVVNAGLDMGRPDRFRINVVSHGRWHSAFCAQRVPRWSWSYRLLAFVYSDAEAEQKADERTLWWLAVTMLPIMISAHSVWGRALILLLRLRQLFREALGKSARGKRWPMGRRGRGG